MKIIISRGEQTFGPYTSDQAKGFLESGELLSSDLATMEGGEEWSPLESLLSSLRESGQEEALEDEESLDDFDHEKMKQWEDVFVDDEVRRRPYDEFDPGALDLVAAQLRWDGRELLDVPRDAGC